jgi:uncharacterized damage-inducible protein DinB
MSGEAARREVTDALGRAPLVIVPMVREVPAALRKRRPAPGKWSAHEHACHLADAQPIFLERLHLMLGQHHPTIRPYNPDREHSPDALLAVDLDEALGRFERERSRLVERVQRLQAAEWDRTAEHPEYSHYSIFIMLRHVVLHDMLHSYRIEECLLMREWA